MAEVSARDKVLLAYSPPATSVSDVDFSDVFGGPPRRSSAQEFDVDEEEGSSWRKLREQPVFGEVAGVRRRYTSDDFFDDIFRGDQLSSSLQSPRGVARRNAFASAPGSRVMSPSRSLPPPAEPFTGPAKFSVPVCSVPGRLTNTDFTASTSTSQNSFGHSLSRFNQILQNDDAGSCSSTPSSVLPRQNSADVKESSFELHSTADGSEFPITVANFHFSIYKWTRNDVPVIISLRKKRGSTLNEDTKKIVRPSQSEKERAKYNDSFISSTTAEVKTKQDRVSPAGLNPTNVIRTSIVDDKARGYVSSFGVDEATSNEPRDSLPKKKKSGNETIIAEKTRHKTGMVDEKPKPSPIDVVPSHKVEKKKEPKSTSSTKKDPRKSEAKGKVKDFVKIFNQETPSGPALRQSQSRRWKDTKTVEVDYEIRFSSARMSDDLEATYVNWGEAWPDALETEDGNSSEKHQFNMNDTGSVPDTARQASPNAPNADRQTDPAADTTAASNDDVLGKEATKGYETKVSQWSKGKEGNIRALLSTLQYVLWPDSGWKPVPLVDIIEGNAVKRAYQKALLRLHPDKLQQKGAPPQHKLIAEKVFDILQEAWDQFNSLGSL